MMFFATLIMGASILVVIQGLFFAISPETAQDKTGIRLNGTPLFIRVLGILMAIVGALGVWGLSGFLS